MNRKHQRGTAVVEFALILPLLLTLIFIVTELGRALMYYNTVVKSVRDAARYLSIQTPGDKITEAKNLVVYGKTTTGTKPLVEGLSTALVDAPSWQDVGSSPIIKTVTVQVTGYTFTPMIGSAFGLPLGPFTFAPISATMRSPL